MERVRAIVEVASAAINACVALADMYQRRTDDEKDRRIRELEDENRRLRKKRRK